MKNTVVSVESSARLHMGFFDLHGGLGRRFGSIGLSLSAPSLQLEMTSAENLVVIGDDVTPSAIARAQKISQQLMQKLELKTSFRLNLKQYMPEHSGLGSGTQLALAIGTAISQLYDFNLSTAQIAHLTGRGGRSGIGIAAFDFGGLLVDGGRALSAEQNANIPPLLARYDFPKDWRILLIFDASQPGIHGNEERVAFNELPEFPESLAAELCRHVLMQAMPAIVEHDLMAFGQSIQALQAHTGDYFAPAQGGRYASPQVSAVLQYLAEEAVACFGQSSWGPTGFAVFENEIIAEKYLQELKSEFTARSLSWLICEACNHGARVELTE